MELIPRKDYFDDLFDLDSMMFDRTPSMKCDIYEEDNKYHIEMDVPGFKRENIKVNFVNTKEVEPQSSNQTPPENNHQSQPQTGDDSALMVYMSLGLMSGLSALGLILLKKKA